MFSKILKYYKTVLQPNTHVHVMVLFVYNRSREIFGNAQETFISLRFEKQTQASTFVTNFSRPNIQTRLFVYCFDD